MSQTGKKNLVITSIALYFTYFIHGIGASIMGQYKPELAAHWGAKALSDGKCCSIAIDPNGSASTS